MVSSEDIKTWIESKLADSQATASGDGQHFEARVICTGFSGKNTLLRHRMVYEALGSRMESEIHALSLKTLTPEEEGNL